MEEIFNEALELPDNARAGFIDERAGDDPQLKAELQKLLLNLDEAEGFIEQPLYEGGKTGLLSALLEDGGEDPMIGQVLGNYVIVREIGRGGMGAVYEGSRSDGEFRLRVAIKVVKRGVDTDFVLKRFRNERQILAALDHPFITRLIDGGTTIDGRPYFVMEYIDGLPLYDYAAEESLTIEQRLTLFLRICDAVEYAHQKLVIHRDLKPSNILICNDGSPRLLDFGIAKLLDPEMASDTLQPTATALRMMTVDYASPEQIRGESVSYESDVYSLGVVLFELLTGRRPYLTSSRTPHDIARAICDDEPALPSRAITGDDVTPIVKIGGNRTSADDLSGEAMLGRAEVLKGNLDNIIMKSLRKDPRQRYPSVQALKEDIDRHLNGEAVSGPHYFSRRLVSREDAPGDGAKLVAVLPLSIMNPTGTESTDESYLTIGLADAIISRLTSVDKLTVRPTSSITRYNEHLINPFRAGIELGVDFVLDGRIRRFNQRLRISLQLLDVQRGAAIWAGQFDERLTDVLELEDAISKQVASALIPHLTGVERKKLAKRGTDSPLAHESYLRGRFYWNQFTSQSFPNALAAFQKAIEIDPTYALAHVGIADFYIWANIYGLIPVLESYKHAQAAARTALEIDERLGEAHASMGLIALNQFEYQKAEEHFLESISLMPSYSHSHEWYSALLIGNGEFARGIQAMLRAEEIDPLSLRTKTLVAWNYYQTGDFEKALEKAEEILKIDPNYPQGHLQRGYILTELGRADEAITSIERCMDLMPGSSLAQYHFAFALAAAGRPEEAKNAAGDLKKRASTEYVKPMFLGLSSLAAGDIDEGFEYLRTAADERDPWLTWFGTEAKYRPFHDDPRYLEILKRTRRTLADGRVKPIDTPAKREETSVIYPIGVTAGIPLTAKPELSGGLFRKHFLKLAIPIFAIFGLVAAYTFGLLTIKVSTDHPQANAPYVANRSIAVLPFENATGDTENDFIADGLSEALIGRLSDLSGMRTISRSAAFSYRSRLSDPVSIGRDLGVETVLAGSLHREGERFTVNTRLFSTRDGRELFSQAFSERVDRTFALQDEMAGKVLAFLDSSARGVEVRKSYTESNDAFRHYLKGEFHRQKGTPADTMTSIRLYEDAIQLDPNYALAYQGLALALRSAPAYGSLTPSQAYPRAKDAALKAIEIDPTLSAASVALASMKATYDWDYAGAEEQYKRAIALGPNVAEAHYSYGNYLVAMGRGDEALSEFRYAQQLDPLSLNIGTNIAWALYIAGRYDEALVAIRDVISRDPTYGRAYMNLGEILQEQGKFDEAITAFQRAKELSKDPLADMALGHVFADAGRTGEARKIAAELEEKVRRNEVSPFLPAVVYAGLKEKDRSFYWLERAYQERSNWLTLLKVGRRMRSLHSDPRFDDLLRRVGF